MFCTSCGREIKDGAKFCVYCGSSQMAGGENLRYKQSEKTTAGNITNTAKGFMEGMTVLDLAIVFIYIVIIARWFGVFVSKLKYTWEVFEYVESDLRLLLIVLFFIPFGIVFLLSLVGIRSAKIKEYHISISVIIAIFALVVKVAAFFLRNAAWGSYLYTGYIVLMLYGSIGVFTIIMCVLNGILLYTKANSNTR